MGFAKVPKSVMLQLERARWMGAASASQDLRGRSEGLDLLVMFWHSAPQTI